MKTAFLEIKVQFIEGKPSIAGWAWFNYRPTGKELELFQIEASKQLADACQPTTSTPVPVSTP